MTEVEILIAVHKELRQRQNRGQRVYFFNVWGNYDRGSYRYSVALAAFVKASGACIHEFNEWCRAAGAADTIAAVDKAIVILLKELGS